MRNGDSGGCLSGDVGEVAISPPLRPRFEADGRVGKLLPDRWRARVSKHQPDQINKVVECVELIQKSKRRIVMAKMKVDGEVRDEGKILERGEVRRTRSVVSEKRVYGVGRGGG